MYSAYVYLEYKRGSARFLYKAVSYVPYKHVMRRLMNVSAWSMGLAELFSLFRERL